MRESKYDVAEEWYCGLSAVWQGKPRRLSESDHWIAGWDAGYKLRADTHKLLNEYLDSIGLKPMGVVRLQSGARSGGEPEKEVKSDG